MEHHLGPHGVLSAPCYADMGGLDDTFKRRRNASSL